jgi:hypothetical protein
MKKYPFIIILTLSLIMASLPVYLQEDSNSDGCVDIIDAVAQIQNLERNMDAESSFQENLATTLSTIKIAAGLLKKIKDNSKEKTRDGKNGSYTMNSKHRNPTQLCGVLEMHLPLFLETVNLYPPSPPPKAA